LPGENIEVMAPRRPITIVGGGLAGLALGIGLRQRDVPVVIWEAGQYPRHRVCGEFISGNGHAVLERLGMLSRCLQAGAVYARTAMFVFGSTRSPIRQLDAPALCISRYTLDALLAETFQQLGGELCIKSHWDAAGDCEGVIYASGRRAPSGQNPSRWFGVKAHVSPRHPVKLEADLEMHISSDGYVGLNYINGGEINVCGLYRRGHASGTNSKQDWLRGKAGSLLHKRLGTACFDPESFCSVAGLELKPQRSADRADCSIGDALTMTPPVTGNGMSMALESAELAMEPLVAYSGGHLDWRAARTQIARSCDAAFGRRLVWAKRLQTMMVSNALHSRLGSMLLRSEWLWNFLFSRTR
jgi:menaquinone-9 beta-reductase